MKSPIIGLGNIWGQGAHFQGGDQAGSNFFRQEHFLQLPSSSRLGYSVTRPELCLRPAPHFRSLRPGTQQGLVPERRPSFLVFSVPPLPSPGLYSRLPEPGAAREKGTHLGSVTCCLGPRAPSESQAPAGPVASPSPSPAQAWAASAAPPAPALPRPAGREGSGSPRKFQVRKPGTHLPGGGAGPVCAAAPLV